MLLCSTLHRPLLLLVAQAAAGGYQDLADLPVEKLIVKERMNCDRYSSTNDGAVFRNL